VIRELGFKKADDFYIALGGAKISAKVVTQKVMQRLREGESAAEPTGAAAALEQRKETPKPTGAASSYGVRVEGIEDVMLRLAKCCRPLVIDRVADRPYPVGAVLLVTRRADAPEISIAPSSVDWPAALLGATFNAYHREPARLERQLEVCARLAATALRRLDVPLGAQAGVVAAAIRRWCERERGACPSAR
jgi:hypothetical protein